MKKSQFTDQQIAFALQQAEGGTPVEEVCRKMGISQATFFRWKKVYGGLMPSEVRKLKQLQEENTRLRKLIADLTLDKEMLTEVIKKDMSPNRGREMIDFVRTCFNVSVRRACRGVPAPRSTYHYQSIRPDQAMLRKRIREIAETRARYGYRRVHILLRREGWPVNIKRVRRLYNLEGLQMRHKSPRRRVMAKLRDDRSNATGPNQVWAMDWMHDELFDGRRLWVLTVVDTFSRVCPVMRVCRAATAIEVIDALDEAHRKFGLPHTIRVDQGSQFTSKELDLWAYANNVTLDFSRPGKPTDNAYVESFNASVRLECLGRHWFLDLDDARNKVEDWRREYNEVRPHSAIGDRTPMSLIHQPRTTSEASKQPEILI